MPSRRMPGMPRYESEVDAAFRRAGLGGGNQRAHSFTGQALAAIAIIFGCTTVTLVVGLVVGAGDLGEILFLFGMLCGLTALILALLGLMASYESPRWRGWPHIAVGGAAVMVATGLAIPAITSDCFGTIFTNEIETCSAIGVFGVLSLIPVGILALLGLVALGAGILERRGHDPLGIGHRDD